VPTSPHVSLAPLEVERTPFGLSVRGTNLVLDPRGRPPLGFLAHARTARTLLPERIIATAGTLALLESANAGALAETAPLPATFGGPFTLGALKLTLLPAGHVRGSAFLRIEQEGKVIIYSGDLGGSGARASRTAEPRARIEGDVLILRATYGHPRYVFPPRAEVLGQLAKFVRSTLDDGLTPVVMAAALGGGQEAALHLGELGHKLRLHPAIHRAARIFEKQGVAFQDMEIFEGPAAPGEVVIIPYGARVGRRGPIGAHRAVLLSGRAVEENAADRAAVDLVLPLSDHAGFDELCALCESAGTERILTVHTYAAELAAELRKRGLEAAALFSEKQLDLPGLG
jgi:putative mRNA 3-end processing factor